MRAMINTKEGNQNEGVSIEATTRENKEKEELEKTVETQRTCLTLNIIKLLIPSSLKTMMKVSSQTRHGSAVADYCYSRHLSISASV